MIAAGYPVPATVAGVSGRGRGVRFIQVKRVTLVNPGRSVEPGGHALDANKLKKPSATPGLHRAVK